MLLGMSGDKNWTIFFSVNAPPHMQWQEISLPRLCLAVTMLPQLLWKQKMQQYSDTKYRAQLSTVNEGDMVLLKQVKTVIFRYLPPLRSIPSRLWKFELIVLIAGNVNTTGASLWLRFMLRNGDKNGIHLFHSSHQSSRLNFWNDCAKVMNSSAQRDWLIVHFRRPLLNSAPPKLLSWLGHAAPPRLPLQVPHCLTWVRNDSRSDQPGTSSHIPQIDFTFSLPPFIYAAQKKHFPTIGMV
jgi:hypothetical protein